MKGEEEREKLIILNGEMAEAINDTERVNELAKSLKTKNDILEERLSKIDV